MAHNSSEIVPVKIHDLAKTLLLTLMAISHAPAALAVCTTLVKGPIAMEVKQCNIVTPERTFTGDMKYNFIRDLPPANRKQFLSTYRGSLIKGTVTQSQAIRTGISDEKGALLNERISAFLPASQLACDKIMGKLIEVDLKQSCCDGGGASPCLLNTGYYLTNVRVSDAAAAAKNTNAKRSPEVQALYSKAKTAVSVKDFKNAAIHLEQIRTKGELDVSGQYLLAYVYRSLDKCNLALPLLEPLHQKFEKKEFWTDTEAPIRKGTMLYARCLSVLGRASEATLVLQGFLVERTRYKPEIRESISHRDFGYIRTSKSWATYKKAADKALGAPPDTGTDDDESSTMFD